MKKTLSFSVAAILAVFSSLFLTSCQDPWMTNTSRNAIEQYMIATVIERISGAANFEKYKGKKVYMDYSLANPQVDKPYLQGRLEMELARLDCIIVDKQDKADIMIQVLVGVLATDYKRFLIGTPPLPIPMPSTSLEFAIPEVAFFKRFQRIAYGRMAFNIFDAKTRAPLEVIPYINGSAQYNNYAILLFPFTTSDMNMKDTAVGEMNFNMIE